MKEERYIVYHHFNGKTEKIGSFKVRDGEIHFDSLVDEYNCDIFPAGKMSESTKERLEHLLDNDSKSVYIVRG